jgi:opacity protein-like surface antigen
MRSVLALSALAVAAMLSASPAAAATVLDVGKNEGCGKANCFNDQGVFTQTWSAKDAMGPMTIGKLLMDRGILGNLDSSTFRLSFKLNGTELGSWGSYMMAGIGGDELSFSGEAFTWNPEDGDLTLVLEIFKPKETAGGGGGGGGFSRASADPDFSYGGVEFEGIAGSPPEGGPNGAISAAPEPAAWALMITGFGLAGASLRQRRTRVVA